MKKTAKWLFPLLAVLLLVPWPIAYAHNYDATATGRQDALRIEVAETSAQPTWTVFGKAIGGVEAGDLFYIDATDNPADIQVTLYLTNAQELIHYYRYMILKVGVYVQSNDGEWEKAAGYGGEPIPDTFITMRNGQVSFTLAGYANYKVTIDGGSFYSFTANAEGDSLSPRFYLEVE